MLTACGIIAEYNPFHKGHRYQMQQARQQSGADVIVVCLSGNFVERGGPSLINKWQKTQLALANGADLVVELPTAYAVEPADRFAQGAVKLVAALGCQTLAFGSEEVGFDYQTMGHRLNQVMNDHTFFVDYQKTYATQLNEFYQQRLGLSITQPNHLLGLSYAQANDQLSQPMRLLPILRIGAGHDQNDQMHGKFASASAIRKMMTSNPPQWERLREVAPGNTLDILRNAPLVTWDDCFALLKYRILTSSIKQLQQIYQMSEGLEYRLKKVIRQSHDFTELLHNLKTKRYTYARLQRLCTYVLLNITTTDINQAYQHPYLRVLGFSDMGRKWLNQQRQALTLPLITNMNAKLASGLLHLQIQVDDVITLLTNCEQNFGRHPIIKSKE
ncbi:MAG: nucleotidyltransferase [Candidatus Paralactobacillus gallistercoris]|uniref:tRNA(Met) cytidine acetate ligase n=1 Tax=Candidatus Paralactobacillus gallistercoris TaxID=2838724 RepID=A0A948X193_9LACO|nr:nucleotidyltransferase [Candidatus Paralactobacillus gallistercoris]